jgi:precorrin-6Y C5,15-methyltransferase (decarboxylating)
MNDAMIDMYDISVMVSKQCGKNGGFENKVLSAIEKDIPIYVIGCEEIEEGLSLKETLEEVSNFTGKSISSTVTYNISLIGTGMGDKSLLTHEASKALDEAQMVMGAKRLLNSFASNIDSTYPIYKAEDIIAKLKEYQEKDSVGRINVAVLFSGDSSFFSGATSLYNALIAEKEAGRIMADINILPGISSVSSFAAKIGVEYSDANILSIHGRSLNNLTHKICCNKDTFLLVSDGNDIKKLGKDLIQAELNDVSITLGVNLSYDDEKIITLTPSECETTDVEGIIICYITNPSFESKRVTPGLKDEAFSRNTTPMTKEEVREVSISKLGLNSDSILLDIGAGTGSISIESALLSDDIKVFAIEKKKEALDILRENTSKFNLDNITIVEGEAPSALDEIHEATHAFIGGSGGHLKEILNKLYKINPTMRVVINAVTIETITEIGSLEGDYKIENYEMVMMQISHSSKVGYYNMMKAENPIWICSFNFC